MKKSKILTPILTACSLASIPLVAITVLSGCNKDKAFVGNLMNESQPTVEPVAKDFFINCTEPDDVKDLYINRVHALKDGFRQDIVYTMSRGLKTYNTFLQDNDVQINSQNFDIRINDIKPEPNRTISFVATMIMKYDYSGSSDEALATCGINLPTMDETINFKMTLDLDTSKDKGFSSVDAKYRQLTATQDNAIEIGVSEIGSTIEEVGIEDPNKYYFIEPQKDYWESVDKIDEYNARVKDIKTLKETGWYTPIAILNHYLGTQKYNVANTPNTLDLGSYYFQNMELDDWLEIYEHNSQIICNGFNISNKLSTSIEKLEKSEWFIEHEDDEDVLFTLPKHDKKNRRINILANNSFVEGTNRGLPDRITQMTIYNNYQSIGSNAISCNSDQNLVKQLIFEKDNAYGGGLPLIASNAFGKMLNLNLIDLSKLDPQDYEQIDASWKNAFANVHNGWSGKTKSEGVIIVPAGSIEQSWAEALSKTGLNIENFTESETSWGIRVSE